MIFNLICNAENQWIKVDDLIPDPITGDKLINRCYDNDHWTGPIKSGGFRVCKERCEGYLFMTYVDRGDNNCACQNYCHKVSRDPRCDLYQSGKILSTHQSFIQT